MLTDVFSVVFLEEKRQLVIRWLIRRLCPSPLPRGIWKGDKSPPAEICHPGGMWEMLLPGDQLDRPGMDAVGLLQERKNRELGSRSFLGNIKSLCIFNEKTFQSLKLVGYFAIPYIWNIIKEQLFTASASYFQELLFGPVKLTGLSRNAPLDP